MNEMIDRIGGIVASAQAEAILMVPNDTPPTMEGIVKWARLILEAMRDATPAMVAAGITAGEDAIDSDWDSGSDGEGYNTYTWLRSDAPAEIYRAMIDAALGEQGENNQ